jgi:ketosteroid isomerase-like protein
VAVVTRFLDAANHHDADGLRACVHPEFESSQPLHPVRDFRGAGQLVSNWKAIFEAEPGFRLTLLRASTTGNTVWAEVHGAGASAEAAGIFIVGVEDGRIRWIRVYSDLIEPLPAEPATEAAPEASFAASQEEEGERGPLRLVPPELEHPRGLRSPEADRGVEGGAELRLVGPVTEDGGDGGGPPLPADGEGAVEVLVGEPDTEEPRPGPGGADESGELLAPAVDADFTAEGPPEDPLWSRGDTQTEAGVSDPLAVADPVEAPGAETVEPTGSASGTPGVPDGGATEANDATDATQAVEADGAADDGRPPGPSGATAADTESLDASDDVAPEASDPAGGGDPVPSEAPRRKGFRFRRGGVRS